MDMTSTRVVILIIAVIATTISAWITARRMRKRIKKTLGTNPSDVELTSINTWMKVKKEEERKGEDRTQDLN